MITAPPLVVKKKNYINAQDGLMSWLLTEDHKRIALLYLIVVTAFFMMGGIDDVRARAEKMAKED